MKKNSVLSKEEKSKITKLFSKLDHVKANKFMIYLQDTLNNS